MDLWKAISSRRSVRAYTNEQITKEQLDLILKAGCAAPIGMGNYDVMHITVIQDKDILNEISAGIKGVMQTESDPLYNAPTLIVVSAGQILPGIDIANTGCILENMMLEATELGIGSVLVWASGMVINNIPGMKEKVSLPEGFNAIAGIVVGHAVENVPEKELEFYMNINHVTK